MDSAASSGPIDMFEEMRSALHTSYELGEPVTPEEVWQMATSWGAASFGEDLAKPWGIYEGSRTPLVRLHLPLMHNIEQVIEEATPANVEWV
jgi:cytosine/adenosine deaminase-related metal-dependent hydrolase